MTANEETNTMAPTRVTKCRPSGLDLLEMYLREIGCHPLLTHDEEIELGERDCDTVFHDGAAIDLGGAIADTLALCLDPYPRSAAADAALKEAGIMTEEQASPFAVLAKLRKAGEL